MRKFALLFVVLVLVGATVVVARTHDHVSVRSRNLNDPATPLDDSTTSVVTTTTMAPTVTIGAVGDVELGTTPTLPAQPSLYFAPIKAAMAAPILFGNLEGTLTNSDTSKCAKNSQHCYAFRVPTSFARVYRSAGFTVMNAANNHSYDFGEAGVLSTTKALTGAGIVQAGLPGEIGLTSDDGVKVAFVDFAPYTNTNDLLNFAVAKQLIAKAHQEASIVVVYMHAGAEGSTADHVTKKTEMFLGENRGNPYAFAHAAINDGADLVLASGPHVLRGMEFYKGHLIAYSLGDFANYENFNIEGDLDLSAILHVTLNENGSFVSGRFTSVVLRGEGQPFVDASHASATFVNRLSLEDFGAHGATIAANGSIRPR